MDSDGVESSDEFLSVFVFCISLTLKNFLKSSDFSENTFLIDLKRIQ